MPYSTGCALMGLMLATAVCGFVMAAAPGAAPPPIVASPARPWLTGSSLKRQLEQPVAIGWSDAPLRQALGNLSRTKQVAIILDRRVDPDQKVTLSLDSTPLADALAYLAHDRACDLTQLGAVIYFGPTASAARLRTLAALRTQDAQRLPADARNRLLAARTFIWDELATPRELLARLAEEADTKIEDPQLVPHDLWAGQSLPPLTWVERLSLVAAQFDLTFRLDASGRSVRLVPIPQQIALERSYPGGAKATELVERWRTLAPEASIETKAGRIVVRGRLEDHQRIAGASKPSFAKSAAEKPAAAKTAARPRAKGTEVHTLLVRQVPLDKLLGELAKKLNFRVQWDQEALNRAGISTAAIVSVDVKDATLDELLTAALEPAGLAFRRNGQVVTIGPKQ